MLSRASVPVQIGAGFFIALLLLGVVAAVSIGRVNVMRAKAEQAAVLGNVSTLTRDVMAQMLDEEAAVRGYDATGDPRYLQPIAAADVALKKDLAALNNADQTEAVDSPRLEQIDIQGAQIERDIATVKKSFAAVGDVSANARAFAALRRDDDALLRYASAQASTAAREFQEARIVLVSVILFSTLAASLVLVLTAVVIGGSIARRLGRVTHALTDVTGGDVPNLTDAFERLSAGDLSVSFDSKRSYIQTSGSDEIAKLAASYNGLVAGLDVVSHSFNRMTQALIERDIETIVRLTRAAEFRDDVTGMHVIRVGYMCEAIARTAGLSDRECKTLLLAAPMHDIGKVATPDRILLKPGPLSAEEFEIMKQHTVAGYEILKDSESIMLKCAADIALTHHERWDGLGYPRGLAKEDIPISGRFCSLVDVFDALTSIRPYKAAWSMEDAVAAIDDAAGSKFDPYVVEVFHDSFDRVLEIKREFSDTTVDSATIREAFFGDIKH